MKQLIWLLIIVALGVGAYWVWNARRRWLEHRRAADERLASFLMQAQIDSRKSPTAPDKADRD